MYWKALWWSRRNLAMISVTHLTIECSKLIKLYNWTFRFLPQYTHSRSSRFLLRRISKRSTPSQSTNKDQLENYLEVCRISINWGPGRSRFTNLMSSSNKEITSIFQWIWRYTTGPQISLKFRSIILKRFRNVTT